MSPSVTTYALYVESGPRKRKTMVHIPDLLGCIAQGPTTDEALAATPEAIRDFLRFLKRHGEAADPDASLTTTVAEHILEGRWLGNGVEELPTDLEPMSADELRVHVRRLRWMREDLSQLLAGLTPAQLESEDEGEGRSIYHILEHISESHGEYVRSTVGKGPDLIAALKAVREAGPAERPAALARMWQISAARLEAMTEVERTQQIARGQVTWTARRGLRRSLEHEWEHLQEISRRLAGRPA